MSSSTSSLLTLFILLLSLSLLTHSSPSPPSTICIIGSGISGSSVAHFLRTYSPLTLPNAPIGAIHIFEKSSFVGGRMATVNLSGEVFEAGASTLHAKNYHASNFTQLLGLKAVKKGDGLSLGIWDGTRFSFKTLSVENLKYPILKKIVDQINSFRMAWRYGVSLLKMDSFIESTLDKFLKYYDSPSSRPVFKTAKDMLQWSGLYNLTTRSLEQEVNEAGISPLAVQELVTVITRINYGQSVSISGLAGAVSMAGSSSGSWAVEGGNWQLAAGLIETSDVDLHLNEEIASITHVGRSFEGFYELDSYAGNSYACDVVVVAASLDELNIQVSPQISIPDRKMQHTFTTFVRGTINPAYFGVAAVYEVPELVGTLENSEIPFSSISVLKKHGNNEFSYKMFSRENLDDELLDQIFSVRNETIKIDWAAYPVYSAPESFAKFVLDGSHLYYVNAFESAASTMETSAVAAENIARLILSRLSKHPYVKSINEQGPGASDASM